MAGREEDDGKVAVGNIQGVTGKVTIAGGDIIEGLTEEQFSARLAQIASQFQPKPFDGRCPYKGLDVFEEEDAEFFFGRQKLVEDIVPRVKKSRSVFIAGPSGSGKSSLVRAGLIPALRNGGISDQHSERWLYATIRPGRDPLEALALAFSRLKSPDLADYFRQHSGSNTVLNECAESVLGEGAGQRLVLFVDQFEETFTQAGKEKAAAFIGQLTQAAGIENGRVSVLFAMRSDFLSDVAGYPALNELLNQQFIQIGAMEPAELVSAIAQPAMRVGLRIDPDLIAQIINDMKGQPGALPLMEFALRDLFDAQQAAGGVIALTREAYLSRGGIGESLERHADATFSSLTPSEKDLARSVFGSLVQVGQGAPPARRTVAFDALVPAEAKASDVEGIVQKMEDARLVTTDDQDKITLSHEVLITAWPWLKKLVEENGESIALQNRIDSDAIEWNEHRRDASYLYSGGRLATAREQLGSKRLVLSKLAQDFVLAGRARQRRTQWLVRASALAAVVISIIVAIAYGARAREAQQEARIALARQVGAQAILQADSRPDLGILLALESFNRLSQPGSNASQDLIRNLLTPMLSGPRPLMYLHGHSGPVLKVAVSPDSRWIASASADQTIRIWDIGTGKTVFVLTGHSGAVNAIAFDPQSKPPLLASAGADGTVRLWKWIDDQHAPQSEIIASLGSPLHALAFSPAEPRLAVAGEDKVIRVYDAATKQVVYNLEGHTGTIYGLAFNSDGTELASSDGENDLRLWDMTTGQPINQSHPNPDIYGQQYMHALTFDNARSRIITGFDYDVTWADAGAATGSGYREDYHPFLSHTSLIRDVAYNGDGTRFASASEDWRIGYCYVSGGGCESILYLKGHEGPVNSVAFSPDDNWLVSGGDDGNVIVWNGLTPYVSHPLQAVAGNVQGLAFARDSKTLAASISQGGIYVLNVDTGAEVTEFDPNQGTLGTLAMSPDGTRLAFGADQGPHRVWNIDGTPTMTLPVEGSMSGVAFSPDGNWLATDTDSHKAVCLWSLTGGKSICQAVPDGQTATQLAFSPDGHFLASDAGPNLVLWQLVNGSLTPRVLGNQNDITFSVAFSPDGKELAAGGSDYTIHLWQLQANPPTSITLRNSGRFARSVAFSPDGLLLVSTNEDWTVRWWDAQTGEPLTPPVKLEDQVRVDSAAFSPDGTWLATGRFDGMIDLWPGNLAAWTKAACQIAHRSLLSTEWSVYFPGEKPRATCPQWPVDADAEASPTP